MSDELVEQLEKWLDEDEFQEIVDAVLEVPAEDRDYEQISYLGRALNNLERYEEALEQFLLITAEGQEDALWHFRTGYSYYNLKRYEEAASAFAAADELEPDDEDTLSYLEWSKERAAKKAKAAKTAKKPKPSQAPLKLAGASDLGNLWNDRDPASQAYMSARPTDELIEAVEERLVFKLPAAYVALMKLHNGGIPRKTYFPVSEAGAGNETADYIVISAILGIGKEKKNSLGGAAGSRVIIEEGGYPEIGVVICECPSGREVVMLDYRNNGNDGEPEVVHVDRDNQYKITYLAANFEVFIAGLTSREAEPTAAVSAINDETVVVGAETETEVEAEAEAPLDIDPESIKPFILVEQDKGGMSVILTVGTYKEELFQLRENEGFEGSGYDWASLAAVFLEEQMPELSGTIRFDPEADMFCAYSADRAALQQFAVRFKAACEDDELMKDLFSRAELD
ncbi:Imm51 family immunity protein [Paenibacillus donghaensis]|uniref:Knr4/Smi1-like domain-containing protein n=1 Tax=Paenibacillus donghaensis TaxID=414771 RepID=A0A2Z2KMP7_9BACL|nr:hypothetical protein B9T62_30860 [Paenibacillus donghaensis]